MRLLSHVAAWIFASVLLAGVLVRLNQADEPAAKGEAPATKAKQGQPSARPATDKAAATKKDEEAPVPEHPFPNRQPAPSLDGGAAWINTGEPIELKSLRGKFVILDFWTYCCINCMHVLPVLKKIEHAYPNEVVVIGVHSAKFDTEQDSKNITEAVLRYEIEHPVVNDGEHKIWNKYFVQSWPSLRLIDPEGNLVAGHSGEIDFDTLNEFIKRSLPYYRQKGVLNETPLEFEREASKVAPTPLRFPGKVMADEAGGRLFIADSNHNRIVMTKFDGTLLGTIGSGASGRKDGDFATAQFDHPQGMALQGDTLYVADTENHMLRKVDLKTKQVATLAGTGEQGRGWPGIEKLQDNPVGARLPDRWVGKPATTALNSPWDLWIHEGDLYIAMAGPHQIWKMPLDESEIGPYAGNGREDIVDGPLLPRRPYEQGYASFAQPSGLTSDGEMLYVADSEGSSIRAVPFDPSKNVRTIVGTADLPGGRLFTFGDVDGKGRSVRLQHALGVAHADGKLYVADTYNNKIKVLDLKDKSVATIAGSGEAGSADDPAEFDEPAGVAIAGGKLYVADTNNHAIRTIDPGKSHAVGTLTIKGLTVPTPAAKPSKPGFPGATPIKLPLATVKPKDGKLLLNVAIELPEGFKMNPEAPLRYLVEAGSATGPVDRAALGKLETAAKPDTTLAIALPLDTKSGAETLKISLGAYYCQEGNEGICRATSVVWTLPIRIAADAKSDSVALTLKAE